MTIQNVAIVGANGRLGPTLLAALRDNFTVTVITRASSKSSYPALNVRKVPDEMPEAELVQALQGQDALVVTMSGKNIEEQKRLATACVKAGVKRIIPADFGSCDSTTALAQELCPLYQGRLKYLQWQEELTAKHPSLTWSCLVCGHFFDWGLTEGFLHFDLNIGTADILDDGEARFSTSTLAQIGRALVLTLQKEDETKNKTLFVQSFCVNAYDVLETLMAVTGTNYTVTFLKSDEFIEKHRKGCAEGEPKATEEIVYALGVLESNWEKKPDFANKLLGLEEENLFEVIKQTVMSNAKQNAPI